MTASLYRNQLERKRKQRLEAEKKTGEYRTTEAKKRADATKASSSAARSTSSSQIKSKLRDAARHESHANKAGEQAAQWQSKAAKYEREEADLQEKLVKAEQREAQADLRSQKRNQQKADRRGAADRLALDERLSRTEAHVKDVYRELREPRRERLRVLLLGASSEGDLRVGREQKRIRSAVESALHRDMVELDVRPAATADDLLDGITGFRPHIVHFSGHSSESVIELEDERDEHHDGHVVTGQSFERAVLATDDPPLLVLLNSCGSTAHAARLVGPVIPFAIGMADEIGDTDAIVYAAQFYAAIADGQSVLSANLSAQAALELAGLDSSELPQLHCAADVDPAATILVEPIRLEA